MWKCVFLSALLSTPIAPAHAQRLSAEQIRVLAAYVWSLSKPATQ